MSIVHMYFKRILETDAMVEYRVICGDVSHSGEWQEIGKVVIDKQAQSYDFFPLNRWLDEKFIPPKLFALSTDKIKEVCDREYGGYGWGAWSSRIHEWTVRLINERNFPEQAPQPR